LLKEVGNLADSERAYSSAWLERIPDKDEVPGSNPGRPTPRKPRSYGVFGVFGPLKWMSKWVPRSDARSNMPSSCQSTTALGQFSRRFRASGALIVYMCRYWRSLGDRAALPRRALPLRQSCGIRALDEIVLTPSDTWYRVARYEWRSTERTSRPAAADCRF
jgi:hypothetical protein